MDGRRFGNRTIRAFAQSTYSVESAVAQNSRSASSDLNVGIFFKVGDTFNIGFDGRIVRGTDVTFGGIETDVDYEQASLLLGFSWGN